MATPAPGSKVDVPIVSFRVITDDKTLLNPAGVYSDQARSYGYNDFSYFERPEHYIRYIEPIESELAVQVEYDMDEQDQEWLDAVNAERKKEQMGPVSYEMFEVIMDKLEKEWFNLIKRIPQPQSHMPVEDSKCAICDDGEGENSNAIVFCDGCNLAVHQDCYGVPYIPEGQWLCRKCTVSPENPVSCLFCPNEGGAFKQTTTGLWSHLLCAIWIPELGVGNAIYMEPVEGVENVPKSRWKLHCSLCKERVGACIQCEKPSCFTAFHVTCARQAGMLMSMKLMGADGQLKAYCDKHIPADWQLASEADDIDDDSYHESNDEDEDEEPIVISSSRKRKRKDSTTTRPTTITTKTARAHAKSYRPGPPIVPRMIVNRLLDYVAKVSINKRQLFIERLCRYWSLKREARRGAPLLKRLHLEPWTATTESRDESEAEKTKKMEFLVALRNDLEKVRLLAELVRKREKEKLRQAQVIKGVVESFVFPHYSLLRSVFNRIQAMDREEIFSHPVDPEEVPDYYVVVKEPICFSQIEEKIDNVAYRSVADFKRDINLIFDNAQLYNKSDTPFYRRAGRYKQNAQPILAELDDIPAQAALLPTTDEWVEPTEGTVGDLETSLVRLQTLLSPDPTEPTRDLLASIFVSEVEKPKSPSPPPPPKRTAADRNKRFAEQEERYRERLALGGGRSSRRGGPAQSSPMLSPAPEPESGPSEQPPSDPVAGPSSTPMGTPRRRTRRAAAIEAEEAEDGINSAASSPGTIKPMKHPERGVLGLQSVPVLTDRQRRAQEKRLDLITTSLDPKDEYKRFNVGWILPEGSKRRRADPPPPPASKEKREKEKGKGRARNSSISSRTSSKRKASSMSIEPEPKRPKRQVADDDDDELTPVPDSYPPTATEEAFPHNRSSLSPLPEDMATPKANEPAAEVAGEDKAAEVDADGDVNMEEAAAAGTADDEATKDAKAVDDTAKESKAGKTADGDASTEEAEGDQDAGPADVTAEPASASEPELAAESKSKPPQLSRAAADKVPPITVATSPVARASLSPTATKPRKIAPRPSESPTASVHPQLPASPEASTSSQAPKHYKGRYQPGVQVWAKLASYPYFPAIIIDHIGQRHTVPQSALDLEEGAMKSAVPTHLVRFYDKSRSFGWVGEDRLEVLGNEERDAYHLAGKGSRFKSGHVKTACKKAYSMALAARDGTKEDAGEEAAREAGDDAGEKEDGEEPKQDGEDEGKADN